MRNQIINFPNQIIEGIKIAQDIKIKQNYNKIVICGMGGSIMPGLILLTYKEHKNKGPGIPIIINNNYNLPSDIDANDLIICISWSGTTEETLSSLKVALERGIKPVVITKGAELGQLAKASNSYLITLPDLPTQPRFSVGYMLGALLSVLGLEINWDLKFDNKSNENIGKELAEKINNKIPLIYSSYSWRKLGALWKANFNETAKVPAFWNYVPQLAHDELNTYTKKGLSLYPIIIMDKNDKDYYLRDLEKAIAILDKQEYNYSIINLSFSDNPLKAIINNYILCLWTTYYLAQKNGVDPEKIELIEEYKKLKKNDSSH
jgi:glucose/mannose-6-phosphate isomerase